jgi:hypothetical protein
MVLEATPECNNIRHTLTAHGMPGTLPDSPDYPDVVLLVAQCWSHDPMLRPTAISVAETLLSTLTKATLSPLSAELDQSIEPPIIASTSPETAAKLIMQIRKQALDIIRTARHLNASSSSIIKSPKKLPIDQYRAIAEHSGASNALDAFLIGSLLYYDGLELPTQGLRIHLEGLCHDIEGEQLLCA